MATTALKPVASGDKVATAGIGILVMQRPYDRQMLRQRGEERRIVESKRGPMQIQDLMWKSSGIDPSLIVHFGLRKNFGLPIIVLEVP